MISEVRLIGFLFNGCLVTNQPQSVLKMFLNFHISNTGTTKKCPYVFTVEKSITVETSVQYSIQKYNHLTADRVMTANIKSLVFYVIMTSFPFYKNMLNFSGWCCSYRNGALLAKFHPGVLNPFVLICGCLQYPQLSKLRALRKRFEGYNKHDSLHLGQKYAWIFVLGHYLFLEAHSFPRAAHSKNCSLLGTDNVRGQMS